MTDPIADFLARIRNAIMARRGELTCPSSTLKVRIADVMKDEGYIQGYDVRPGFDGHSEMVVRLRWTWYRDSVHVAWIDDRPGRAQSRCRRRTSLRGLVDVTHRT